MRCPPVAQLRKGDVIMTHGAMRNVEFKVTSIVTVDGDDAAEYCTVTDDTEILVEENYLNREDDESRNEIGYDDIGGCRSVYSAVHIPHAFIDCGFSAKASLHTRTRVAVA
jgi:hypothetical protein